MRVLERNREGAGPRPPARLYAPARKCPQQPALAQQYPPAFISPPHRHFLNSTFANLDFALKDAGVPTLKIHPSDAAARCIAEDMALRVFNDRGQYTLRARITDPVRCSVVSAPSVWWKKLSPDGHNANELASQAIADMGRSGNLLRWPGGSCLR